MRAILVDDESLALRGLENQLRKIGGTDIVGTYQNPLEALEAAALSKPDVVFLDIEMPEIGGIEAALGFQNLSPSPQIVFVTAYEEYAVKAFELEALDYVLKPCRTERLALTLQRVAERIQSAPASPPEAPSKGTVRCLGRLQVETGPDESLSWRTAKSQELFSYLLLRQGQPARKDVLVDILWPESDPKKAYTQLYTSIYQLRRTLEAANLPLRIVNSGNSYSLARGGLETDAEEWERRLGTETDIASLAVEEYEEIMNINRGELLEDSGYLWAEQERERLSSLWFHHAKRLAAKHEEKGDTIMAAAWYNRILQRFPYSEEAYLALMELYARLGERSLVEQHYKSLCAATDSEFGTEPSAEIQAWYRNWRRD
ncbi:response regulator [Cohnella fermenti]|uniref:Response regulator n=1 Tax=Cohnella fermenti TaxID=2565925 RepID=A0A4S4C813_9BACL|nr:response regulator [Cohnella fermenti]THF84125.1 response regulator [Cohnella fermenti]